MRRNLASRMCVLVVCRPPLLLTRLNDLVWEYVVGLITPWKPALLLTDPFARAVMPTQSSRPCIFVLHSENYFCRTKPPQTYFNFLSQRQHNHRHFQHPN